MAARIGQSKFLRLFLCIIIIVSSLNLVISVSGQQISFTEQDFASALARVTLSLFNLGGLANQTEQIVSFGQPKNVPVSTEILDEQTNHVQQAKQSAKEIAFKNPKNVSLSVGSLTEFDGTEIPNQSEHGTNSFFMNRTVSLRTDSAPVVQNVSYEQEGNATYQYQPANVSLSIGVQEDLTEQEKNSIGNVPDIIDGPQNSIEQERAELDKTLLRIDGTSGLLNQTGGLRKSNDTKTEKSISLGMENAIVKSNYTEKERIRPDRPRPHYVKILKASLGTKSTTTSRPPTPNYAELLKNVSSNSNTSSGQVNYTVTVPDKIVLNKYENVTLISIVANGSFNSKVQEDDMPVVWSDKSENVSLSTTNLSANNSTVQESAPAVLDLSKNETIISLGMEQVNTTVREGKAYDNVTLVKDSVIEPPNQTEQKVDTLDKHDKVQIPISSTVVPVQIDRLQYTEQEQKALDRLRELVSGDLTQSYQTLDSYLIRWLRYKNFDMEASYMMLQKNLKWRKDNNIDNILNEKILSFSPPVYTNNGFDYEGRPVITFTPTVVDLRRFIAAGQGDRVVRYWDQILEEAEHRIENASTRTGGKINKGLSLMDLSAFNVRQHTCFGCISTFIDWAIHYENYHPDMALHIVWINAPRVFIPVGELVKPLLAPGTRKALKIFAADRKEWSSFLHALVSPSQLPFQFGGTKNN